MVIEGLRLYGSPWQPWFFDWAFNYPRGVSLKPVWDLIPETTDLLITRPSTGPWRSYSTRRISRLSRFDHGYTAHPPAHPCFWPYS